MTDTRDATDTPGTTANTALLHDVVIVAGGRGSRLGGVSKADLRVGGVRLLDRVLAAAHAAQTTVVVGPVDAPVSVLVTQEDPPGSGPAAGLVAGLDAIAEPAPWTVVLAVDVPDAPAAVSTLLQRAHADATAGTPCGAYALTGDGGQPQWLLGLYDSATLRAAARAYGDPRGRSVRGLLAGLHPTPVDAPEVDTTDIDTWGDHARWNAFYRRKGQPMHEDTSAWRPFIEDACAATGVDPALVDETAVLAMTREVAHAGARPMAPVAAYILGLAVGDGGDPAYLRGAIEDAATAAPAPDQGA